MEESNKENLIVNLTLEFAIEIVKYCDALEERRKYVICQAIAKIRNFNWRKCKRSCRMQKANLISFINSRSLQKKSEETEYWLLICKNSTSYPDSQCY